MEKAGAVLQHRPSHIAHQLSFFFASSGTVSFVVPTSLISTVVVRLISTSLLLKVILPCTLYWYFARAPSLVQNFTVPFGSATSGPSPPGLRKPRDISAFTSSAPRVPV